LIFGVLLGLFITLKAGSGFRFGTRGVVHLYQGKKKNE